jgi:hypothetical protein
MKGNQNVKLRCEIFMKGNQNVKIKGVKFSWKEIKYVKIKSVKFSWKEINIINHTLVNTDTFWNKQ